LYISNYCFEVWLWSHFKNPDEISSEKSSELKTELGKLNVGNYPFCFMDINLINLAISNCEKADLDKTHYYPAVKSSKVYILINELLSMSYINKTVSIQP